MSSNYENEKYVNYKSGIFVIISHATHAVSLAQQKKKGHLYLFCPRYFCYSYIRNKKIKKVSTKLKAGKLISLGRQHSERHDCNNIYFYILHFKYEYGWVWGITKLF